MPCMRASHLCRFEFLEALVRVAVSKYITPRVSLGVCASVSRLFEECIEPNLGAIARLDANTFRHRMYCEVRACVRACARVFVSE